MQQGTLRLQVISKENSIIHGWCLVAITIGLGLFALFQCYGTNNHLCTTGDFYYALFDSDKLSQADDNKFLGSP